MATAQPTLTGEQLEECRTALQRTLSRLERSAKANEARPVEIDQSAVGRLSRIEAIQNQGFTQSLQERERVQHTEVLAALERMEEGVYGICTSCRAPIRFERLVVFPETRTCSQCGSGG